MLFGRPTKRNKIISLTHKHRITHLMEKELIVTHISHLKCMVCTLAAALLGKPSDKHKEWATIYTSHTIPTIPQGLCAIWLNKYTMKKTIVLGPWCADCEKTVYSQMISVQSKREIISSRTMASDCPLSKRGSGRWLGGKGRSKSTVQTAKAGYADSFEMHHTERMG